MAQHAFWTDRDDFADTLPAVARVLGFTFPENYDFNEQLDCTWCKDGPWFLLFEDEQENIRVSLAIDECWGVVYDITCSQEKFPELVALMTSFNPWIAKLKMCRQCGCDLNSSTEQCPVCGTSNSQQHGRHPMGPARS
jgi:hypothetical protein